MASIVVVIHLYIFYLMLSKNDEYKLSFTEAWNPAVWGLWFLSMIFFMTYVCAKAKNESNKVSTLIHQITFDENDVETKNCIEMFSIQMLYQKVEFVAGGLFLMDYSCLHCIVASVTTYLVFFIQFEMAARNNQASKNH